MNVYSMNTHCQLYQDTCLFVAFNDKPQQIFLYRLYYIYICTFYEAYTRMIYNRQTADVHANLHSNEHNNLLYEYYIAY